MKPENLITEQVTSEQSAADHMKVIIADFDLPESYQRLVNGPWRLVAQTIIEQFGEGSDAWSRMTWFTRILCTAIETSLERQTPEAVNDALNGFNIWLSSLREQGESYSLCVNAANYAQRRISAQICEDTGDADRPVDTEDETASAMPAADNAQPSSEADQPEAAESAIHAATDDCLAENRPNAIETLSLSLAYSASKPVNEDCEPAEHPGKTEETEIRPPENTERGIDMEMQSQASVTNSQPQPLETSQAAAAPSPAPGNHLTEAASISPVPMGTWLAFHDQDVPTLARLAMYDPAEDAFMLGNNHGILVRRINTSELSRLIDSEMVQLVEFRSINQ